MKQISARKFRLTFQETLEPVIVQRRDRDGTIHLLGEWHPYVDGAQKRAAYETVTTGTLPANPIRAASQSRKDAILRKVNRTGQER